ncbi:MAG: hypothetical protein ACPHCN_07210 [Mycobacterium sp.]
MVWEREYGVATEIYVPVPKVDDTDLAATGDYAYAAGDIKLSKDGAATANPASSPTEIDMGTYMLLQIDLSATEMQCETLIIALADSALEHNVWIVETYGHASARWPGKLSSASGAKLESQLSVLVTGTAQAGAASSITLASGESSTDDHFNNWMLYIVSGTGVGQSRFCDDYTGSTRVADVSPAWGTTPDATSVYVGVLVPPSSTSTPPDVNLTQIEGSAVTSASGVMEVNVTEVSGSAEDLPTATALAAAKTVMDDVLVDTGITIPATIATIDSNVDAILVDTGTTLDTKINTLDTNLDAVLVDTGTTLPASLATIDSNVDAILVDTGTTLDGKLDTIDGTVDTINANVAALNDMSLADLYGYAVEDTTTFEEMLRLMAAVLIGKVSGNPGSPAFRSLGDDVDRVAATTDSDGNRTSVVLDATD